MSDKETASDRARKPNHLINEASPYLRQHADNPVDWYPWGEEALARARAEDKPILLSIGYSACHWCHVMERESFEDENIARLLNENFIPIKVDREERPDLDQIYMEALQMMTGGGGWPLNIFLTPDGKPFWGGTYFPPADRQGMPGFDRILAAIDRAYRDKSPQVRDNLEKLTLALKALGTYRAPEGEIARELPLAAANVLARAYDSTNGGLGRAPKFPNTFVFSLFLRLVRGGSADNFSQMVLHTLSAMAKGGIYDQIGGGFHRYSVDERWLVPHFEKMLYDNALLARLYLDAARALNEQSFLTVAHEIFEYVLRDMTAPEGAFYSTQDADSEGEEGKFYLWTPEEVEAALDEKLSPIAERFFDISEPGNFEGRNIPHRTIEVHDAAKMFRMSPDDMAAAIEEIKRRLLSAREKRVKPGRDDKILAAWNAMMVSAFAEGYRALHDPRYLAAAEKAGAFAMEKLWDGRRLKRSYQGGVARFNAYLEDYALLANAMIDLYQATLNPLYLDRAKSLVAVIREHFTDQERGGFFFTSDDHEQLITRFKAAFDGATPSGNSATVMAFLRLHGYCGEEDYLREATGALRLFREMMEQQPFAFSHMLEAVDLYLRGATEIVLVGDRNSAEFEQWLARIGLLYLPDLALFAVDPKQAEAAYVPEQARGKTQKDGRLTAYVCRARTCSAPITSFEDLKAEVQV